MVRVVWLVIFQVILEPYQGLTCYESSWEDTLLADAQMQCVLGVCWSAVEHLLNMHDSRWGKKWGIWLRHWRKEDSSNSIISEQWHFRLWYLIMMQKKYFLNKFLKKCKHDDEQTLHSQKRKISLSLCKKNIIGASLKLNPIPGWE